MSKKPQQDGKKNSDFSNLPFTLLQAPLFLELFFIPSSLMCAVGLTEPAITALELFPFQRKQLVRKHGVFGSKHKSRDFQTKVSFLSTPWPLDHADAAAWAGSVNHVNEMALD